MAKITRYGGNLLAFASSAIGTERTIFGDVAQSDTLDDNITADFFRGWGIVLASEVPTKQDFNGLAYTMSQVLAYLHQVGVSEWQVAQEYHTDSITNRNGVLYFSTVDDNIGTDPATDVSGDWVLMAAENLSYDNATAGLVAELVQDAIDELASSSIIAVAIVPAADADVVLTATQASRDRLILADGSWTVGRNIIVPDESRRFYVDNIAGTYNVVIKTAAGTGITVLAGGTAVLVCDGVNVLNPHTIGGKLSGDTVQRVNVQDGEVATGTTVLPFNDTIPQNTEGDEYLSLAITPTKATNLLKIDVVMMLTHTTATDMMAAALFQDATANALAAFVAAKGAAADSVASLSFTHWMAAGTVAATTFKVRAGNPNAGTTGFNGSTASTPRIFGGVMASSITITEIEL